MVTGAGRGIGRQHAITLAAAGAWVLVNDVGAATDGTGSSLSPAEEVVAEIRACPVVKRRRTPTTSRRGTARNTSWSTP